MMSPKEREEQLAIEQKIQKELRANYVNQKRKAMSKITDAGILALQYEIDMIEKNPRLKPDNGLNLTETINAMNEAVDHHLNKLK